jgi:hypothetical protein
VLLRLRSRGVDVPLALELVAGDDRPRRRSRTSRILAVMVGGHLALGEPTRAHAFDGVGAEADEAGEDNGDRGKLADADSGNGEAAEADDDVEGQVPASPSAHELELETTRAKAHKLFVAGAVLGGIGGFVLVLGLPPLVAGSLDRGGNSGLFQTETSPESARLRRRLGGGMALTGLAIAGTGLALLLVGSRRKRRADAELYRLRAGEEFVVAPLFLPRGGGVALGGRF